MFFIFMFKQELSGCVKLFSFRSEIIQIKNVKVDVRYNSFLMLSEKLFINIFDKL